MGLGELVTSIVWSPLLGFAVGQTAVFAILTLIVLFSMVTNSAHANIDARASAFNYLMKGIVCVAVILGGNYLAVTAMGYEEIYKHLISQVLTLIAFLGCGFLNSKIVIFAAMYHFSPDKIKKFDP